MTPRPQTRAIRRGSLLLSLLAGFGLVGARVVELQWIEGNRWATRAEEQQRQQRPIPAPRGIIYDRNGVPLAANREVLRISVAPHELEDRQGVARHLRQVLGLSESEARRAVDTSRRWVVLPGRYEPTVRDRLADVTGIYFETLLERFYPQGELAIEILGRVGADGVPQGGLELELDAYLRGKDGVQVVRRDGRGRPIPGAMLTVSEPIPGHDVYLTIDAGLQEIVQEALGQAVVETSAAGGDLLLLDPRTGEILASVTRRTGGPRHWRATTDPYEPGSTLKPFLVAALLSERKATLGDSIWAERGTYRMGSRTVSDVSPHEWLTLADALRVSSNIAMVKMSERLDPAEHYAYLRDFGFGTPTGVLFPSEAAGVLRRPTDWSRYSQGSLAIGYEISATPLQMALAYGALANGGTLMEPRLVSEVRARDGRAVKRFPPRRVRRVIPESVAREVAAVLADAVESGTGREAGLGPFRVAGKTGTARISAGGRYERSYIASFAGFFPVVDPQLVFLVKLDRPQGAYYGGVAAAPVTRVMLSAALAARSTPLDRGAVAATLPAPAAAALAAVLPVAARTGSTRSEDAPPAEPFVFALSAAPPGDDVPPAAVDAPVPADEASPAESEPETREVVVPDLRGYPLREAAAWLHDRGLAVRVEGSGDVADLTPKPGSPAPPGTVVTLRARERLR